MPDRVVFDCMVFLQAAARPQRTSQCFEFIRTNRAELCLSREVLDEIHDVLSRPGVRRKFRSLTDAGVAAFLEDIVSRARWFECLSGVFPLRRDPKDEKYVDLAVAANARHLVSWDGDLLALMRPDEPSGAEFLQQFPALRIVTPLEFIQLMQIV